VLDGAVALAGVFVELVKDDEHQRPPAALAFLAGEFAAQRDADDEALCAVGQVVQLEDGDVRNSSQPGSSAISCRRARSRRRV